MKKLLLALLITGCSKTANPAEINPAEIMIRAQVPDAKCVDYGTKDGISLVRCAVKGKDTTVSIIGAYSVAHPFQTWPLYTADQLNQQKQAQAQAQAQAQKPAEAPAPAPAPAGAGVDSPVGEGSGSHAHQ